MNEIFDLTNASLGRSASHIAKYFLNNGGPIVINNVHLALISGNRVSILQRFKTRRDVGRKEKGPYYPRREVDIYRRVLRGMLPHRFRNDMDMRNNFRFTFGLPFSQSTSLSNIYPVITSSITLQSVSDYLGADIRRHG